MVRNGAPGEHAAECNPSAVDRFTGVSSMLVSTLGPLLTRDGSLGLSALL